MFMALNLSNHWKGQFFTPYSICRMMSEITVEDLEPRIEGKGWVGINQQRVLPRAYNGMQNGVSHHHITSTAQNQRSRP